MACTKEKRQQDMQRVRGKPRSLPPCICLLDHIVRALNIYRLFAKGGYGFLQHMFSACHSTSASFIPAKH